MSCAPRDASVSDQQGMPEGNGRIHTRRCVACALAQLDSRAMIRHAGSRYVVSRPLFDEMPAWIAERRLSNRFTIVPNKRAG